jgi:steroid delta-isomerase-like uncharacterized protein
MSADNPIHAVPRTNEVVVRRFLELMDSHQFDELASVLAPDLRFHLGSATMTRDDLLSWVRLACTAFPDLQHHVDDLLSVGSRVVARATNRATHQGEFQGIAPTGRTVTIGQIAIYELRDGKIAEAWEQADFAGLMAQLTAS